MFGADTVVADSAVLEVVAVAVGGELLPLGSHLGGGVGEVVLGAEVLGVVGPVDGTNVVQKLFEGLATTVGIDEGGEGFVELVEGLEAGEDEVGGLQLTAHIVGHGDLTESTVEGVGVGADEVLNLVGAEDGDGEGGALLAEEGTHHGVKLGGELTVEVGGEVLIPGGGEAQLSIGGEETAIAAMEPCIVSRA
jgi:hypothetical protein